MLQHGGCLLVGKAWLEFLLDMGGILMSLHSVSHSDETFDKLAIFIEICF